MEGPTIRSVMVVIPFSTQCVMWRSGMIPGRLVIGSGSDVVGRFICCVSISVFHA